MPVAIPMTPQERLEHIRKRITTLEEKLRTLRKRTLRNIEPVERTRARIQRYRDIEKKLLAHIASTTDEVDDA